jgi:hypothetical protein
MISSVIPVCLALACAGGGDEPFLPDPAFASVDYTSPQVQSTCLQRFALFVPPGQAPASGWPVIVNVSNAGLNSTDPAFAQPIYSTFAPIYQFLDAGFAVVRSSMTYSGLEQADPCGNGLTLGNGLFHPPGIELPGLAQAAYSDPQRHMAEKDAAMLMQHVRFHAAEMGLDDQRIAIFGRSGGAIVSMWVALGPERGPELFPAGVGQDGASTRPDAAVLRGGLVWFEALKQTSSIARHFPHQDGEAPYALQADSFLTAMPGFAARASAVVYEDFALNEANRSYLSYADVPGTLDFLPATPGGADYVTDVLLKNHSSWHGYVWKNLHPNDHLAITTPEALVPGGSHDSYVPDKGHDTHDMLAYLFDDLALTPVYENHGGGVPGSDMFGAPQTPVLLANGPFSTSEAPTLGLSMARGGLPAILVAGFSQVDQAWFGGVLGPSPDLFLPYATNASGALHLPVAPGVLPSGLTIYLQFWIADPTGPEGWTASNTISLTAP